MARDNVGGGVNQFRARFRRIAYTASRLRKEI
jgi:hypothetical protein